MGCPGSKGRPDPRKKMGVRPASSGKKNYAQIEPTSRRN